MSTLTLTTTTQLSRAAAGSALRAATAYPALRPLLGTTGLGVARHFSSTPPAALKTKQWFPPPEPSRIKYAGPAWEHPV